MGKYKVDIPFVDTNNIKVLKNDEMLELFKRYNIGLATLDKECFFEILHKPISAAPYSLQLNSKLKKDISSFKTN